ncbi:MAG: universal stress protein [Leptolyngbya sp. SIOISBB]|nr:universal stress protein [Leptolyngbya sp. SIOISBB]
MEVRETIQQPIGPHLHALIGRSHHPLAKLIAMRTYQKILVAIDQSPRSEAVLKQATTLAKLQGAKLLLLHCLTLPHSNQDFGDRYNANLEKFIQLAQQQVNDSMEATRQWMHSFVREAEAMGVDVDWDWRMGEAGKQLCTVAQDWGADLIVMGRRGHQGLKEIVLGSVSNYVIHRAPCSVMVIQSPAAA